MTTRTELTEAIIDYGCAAVDYGVATHKSSEAIHATMSAKDAAWKGVLVLLDDVLPYGAPVSTTRPADGTEAVCAGCGRTVTWSCPSYVPTEHGSWTDCDVVDVDADGRGNDGRSCVDGQPHRPVAEAVSA